MFVRVGKLTRIAERRYGVNKSSGTLTRNNNHHHPVAAPSSLAVAYSTNLHISLIDLFILLQCRRDANDAVRKPLLATEISFMSGEPVTSLFAASKQHTTKITLARLSPLALSLTFTDIVYGLLQRHMTDCSRRTSRALYQKSPPYLMAYQ